MNKLEDIWSCFRSPFSAVFQYQKKFADDIFDQVKAKREAFDRHARDLVNRKVQLHLDELEEHYLCCVCLKKGKDREEGASAALERYHKLQHAESSSELTTAAEIAKKKEALRVKQRSLAYHDDSRTVKHEARIMGLLPNSREAAQHSNALEGTSPCLTPSPALLVAYGEEDTQRGRFDETDMKAEQVAEMNAELEVREMLENERRRRCKVLIVVSDENGREEEIDENAPVPHKRRVQHLRGSDDSASENCSSNDDMEGSDLEPNEELAQIQIDAQPASSTASASGRPLSDAASPVVPVNSAAAQVLKPQSTGWGNVSRVAAHKPKGAQTKDYCGNLDRQSSDMFAIQLAEEERLKMSEISPVQIKALIDKTRKQILDKKRDAHLVHLARTGKLKHKKAYRRDKGLIRIHDTDIENFSIFFKKPVRGYLCDDCYNAARSKLDRLTLEISSILDRAKDVPYHTAKSKQTRVTLGASASTVATNQSKSEEQRSKNGDLDVLPERDVTALRQLSHCGVCQRRQGRYFLRINVLFLCQFCTAKDKMYRDNCILIGADPMPAECVSLLISLRKWMDHAELRRAKMMTTTTAVAPKDRHCELTLFEVHHKLDLFCVQDKDLAGATQKGSESDDVVNVETVVTAGPLFRIPQADVGSKRDRMCARTSGISLFQGVSLQCKPRIDLFDVAWTAHETNGGVLDDFFDSKAASVVAETREVELPVVGQCVVAADDVQLESTMMFHEPAAPYAAVVGPDDDDPEHNKDDAQRCNVEPLNGSSVEPPYSGPLFKQNTEKLLPEDTAAAEGVVDEAADPAGLLTAVEEPVGAAQNDAVDHLEMMSNEDDDDSLR